MNKKVRHIRYLVLIVALLIGNTTLLLGEDEAPSYQDSIKQLKSHPQVISESITSEGAFNRLVTIRKSNDPQQSLIGRA